MTENRFLQEFDEYFNSAVMFTMWGPLKHNIHLREVWDLNNQGIRIAAQGEVSGDRHRYGQIPGPDDVLPPPLDIMNDIRQTRPQYAEDPALLFLTPLRIPVPSD
jgi:hypothetical protein